MKKEQYSYILRILKQTGGPVKITYQIKQITLISGELIEYHIEKMESFMKNNKDFYEEYSISDIYSLYMCLDFIITDLGKDEFETILGEDFHNSGLRLLSDIKQLMLTYVR